MVFTNSPLRHVRSSANGACQVQEARFIRVSRQTVWDTQVRKNEFWCEAEKLQMQQTVLVLKWLLLLIFHVSCFRLSPSAEIDQQTVIKAQK